jgi:hypothetical protein
MENKYFTPDMEDIHIGYECEILYPHNMIEYNKKLNENLWKKHKFELRESLSEGDSVSFDYIYRTLYLTKEQIEAEGWKEKQMHLNGTFVMILGKLNKGYELMFTEGNSQIVITKVWTLFDEKVKRDNVFKGNCKDINTFRKIIKLLEI